jgi:hypothetical protein
MKRNIVVVDVVVDVALLLGVVMVVVYSFAPNIDLQRQKQRHFFTHRRHT